MTREEAVDRLRGILTEAVEFEDSVCYVTEEDREPLEMAIKALEEPTYYPPCIDCNKKMDEIRRAYNKLKKQEPKTGHWISEMIQLKCSECGYIVYPWNNTNYCPNCGAKMIEPQEDKEEENDT